MIREPARRGSPSQIILCQQWELISTGAAAASNTAGAGASWGPISYPSPAAQVKGPWAMIRYEIHKLEFQRFHHSDAWNSQLYPSVERRSRCHWLQTHLWLCVMFVSREVLWWSPLDTMWCWWKTEWWIRFFGEVWMGDTIPAKFGVNQEVIWQRTCNSW